MKERLQKLISAAGLTSRRDAEKWIADGRVFVNGLRASLGDSADPSSDRIEIDGRPLTLPQSAVTVLLNKPAGYVTTMRDEHGRRTVAELTQSVGVRVYPVGRLDLNSCGALLMTSDGDLANRLTHPSHEVPKTYHVTVTPADAAPGHFDITPYLPILAAPTDLDGYLTRPARVKTLRKTPYGIVVEMVIHEGRNRQIRRICEGAGLRVTRLCRVRIGTLSLGDLKPGQWRKLSDAELHALLNPKEWRKEDEA
ncbi:MAG: pseudouridine synthase [Eubacteriales bacterium]|jgi:23S rRNA pseudouridine2605 synthase